MSAVIGVLVSLFIVTHLAIWLFNGGWFVKALGALDDFLSIVVIAVYGVRFVYPVLREILKGGEGSGHASLALVA